MPLEKRLRGTKFVEAQRVVDGAREGELGERPVVERFEGAQVEAIGALGVVGATCRIPASKRVRSVRNAYFRA
jgi:hypothetical protein